MNSLFPPNCLLSNNQPSTWNHETMKPWNHELKQIKTKYCKPYLTVCFLFLCKPNLTLTHNNSRFIIFNFVWYVFKKKEIYHLNSSSNIVFYWYYRHFSKIRIWIRRNYRYGSRMKVKSKCISGWPLGAFSSIKWWSMGMGNREAIKQI